MIEVDEEAVSSREIKRRSMIGEDDQREGWEAANVALRWLQKTISDWSEGRSEPSSGNMAGHRLRKSTNWSQKLLAAVLVTEGSTKSKVYDGGGEEVVTLLMLIKKEVQQGLQMRSQSRWTLCCDIHLMKKISCWIFLFVFLFSEFFLWFFLCLKKTFWFL